MITSKEDLQYYLAEDKKRNFVSRKGYFFSLITGFGGGKTIQLLRCLRYYEYASSRKGDSLLRKFIFYYRKIMYLRLASKLDTYIQPNCVGPGLQIPHLGGIIINCKKMGRNCSVNKGVVIGNKKGQSNIATIGDNCWFTLGSKVIGKINIGNNVIVCQNSVVVKDVEDNCIVSGVPAKIIKRYSNIEEINI